MNIVERSDITTSGALAMSPQYARPNAWLLTVIADHLSLVLDVGQSDEHRRRATYGIARLRIADPAAAGYVRIA